MDDPTNVTPIIVTSPTARAANDGQPRSPEDAAQTARRASGRLLLPILATGIALGGVALATFNWNYWTAYADSQSTDDATVGADVSMLSARVSGNIKQIAILDYQSVTAGQLIAQIDSAQYDAAVASAEASVAAARATLDNLGNQRQLQTASVAVAVAQSASAAAQRVQTKEEFDRQSNLGGATSEQKLQEAKAAYLQADALVQSSNASIEQQKAQLKVLDGQQPLLQAQLDAAQAGLSNALLLQGYTRIYAPYAGVVGKKLVHEGDFVNIGTSIVSEVPLPNVYVTANFKETQLAQMSLGKKAEISIDSFPGQTLFGTVSRLSPASGAVFALLPPDNATGNFTKVVQRVPVRIDFDANQPLVTDLRPGMSATISVNTTGNQARSP